LPMKLSLNELYYCKKCGYAARTKMNMNKHLIDEHFDSLATINSNDVCHICKNRSRRKPILYNNRVFCSSKCIDKYKKEYE